MTEAQKLEHLEKLATLMRYSILTMTTQAGSGHPTSSLSATELMAGLMFGGIFRYDLDQPQHPNNDRLIFSKGHATPLFYSLWAMAGKLTAAELMTYRHFGSPLEGHPTMSFPYTEAATGSLGQGLSIGLGVALNAKYLDKLPYTTYVLLGDSEMAEGSQWETMQLAAHYKLDNLVGVLDVNRLGQRGETMYGWDLMAYENRIKAFGWETIIVKDGHSFPEVLAAYEQAMTVTDKPVMIIAHTIKGKGVSFIENKNGWHGKTLNQEELARALPELGPVDHAVRGVVSRPEDLKPAEVKPQAAAPLAYKKGDSLATRKAYGNALKRLYPQFPRLVSLDCEVSNSTYAEIFEDAYPQAVFRNVHRRAKHGGRRAGPGHPGQDPLCLHLCGLLLPGLRPGPHEPVHRAQPQVLRVPRRGLHRRRRAVPDGPGGSGHVPVHPGQRGPVSLGGGVHGAPGGSRPGTPRHRLYPDHPHGHPDYLRPRGKIPPGRLQGAAPERQRRGDGHRRRRHPV